MSRKAIVTANHNNQTATLAFVDESGNSPVDFRGQEFKNMKFPYENISMYDFLFESLGPAANGIEHFHFKGVSFN